MTTPALFGFINAFKPPGPSSAAFGSWVRRRLGATAVGHWGTLDPMACGVLVLALGKAARLLPLLDDSRKRYVFELVVGEKTTTGDASGAVTERRTPPTDWSARLAAALPEFAGQIEQVPPAFSAVKLGGSPLYRSARRGEPTSPRPRRLRIYALRLIAVDGEARARLEVHCDAGTYVRALCEQLGERLGVPARMGALLRTAAGPFSLGAARLPAEIDSDPVACIINPLSVIDRPKVSLGAVEAQRFARGNDVALPDGVGDGAEIVVMANERCIGTGRVKGARVMPTRVLV